jgi:hypothetical protein
MGSFRKIRFFFATDAFRRSAWEPIAVSAARSNAATPGSGILDEKPALLHQPKNLSL